MSFSSGGAKGGEGGWGGSGKQAILPPYTLLVVVTQKNTPGATCTYIQFALTEVKRNKTGSKAEREATRTTPEATRSKRRSRRGSGEQDREGKPGAKVEQVGRAPTTAALHSLSQGPTEAQAQQHEKQRGEREHAMHGRNNDRRNANNGRSTARKARLGAKQGPSTQHARQSTLPLPPPTLSNLNLNLKGGRTGLTELMADLNLRRALNRRSLSMFLPRSRFSSSAASPTIHGCFNASTAVIRLSWS